MNSLRPNEYGILWGYPMPPPTENARKGEQTIITLGLELEFLLLNLKVDDDPHAIVKDALEVYGRAPFGQIVPGRSPSLPEVRCDIRLDHVVWFPHGKCIQKTTRVSGRIVSRTFTRYNRRHFNIMDEYGLDPLREVGTFGPVLEVVGNGKVRKRASMEVSTPIMREGSWTRVIPSMLDSLWALGQSRLEIGFNENTGLHVHVGRRGGWSICQLKKILKAVVIFEEEMDAQHPASRVRSALDDGAVNVLSNVQLMNIGHLSKLERVRYVDSRINNRTVKTRDEGVMRLCILTNNGYNKCTKYNFLPVREAGTVEFRQAIASLDRDQVGCWVAVVLDFVNAAITTTRKEFEQWAENMDGGHAHITQSFLAQGNEYRLRSINWSGDFEDEFLEVESEQSQVKSPGVQPCGSTGPPEEESVPGRKGKGVLATLQKLRNNYEESGRGRNKRGKGESSKMGAQYHENRKVIIT